MIHALNRSAACRSQKRFGLNGRVFWFSFRIVLGSVAALWLIATPSPAQAQSHTIYVEPTFLWNFYNVQGCGYCNDVPGPYETSLAQAWSDAQAVVDQTSAGYIWTAQDLIATPGSITFNGYPYQNEFSVQSCPSGGGSCSYYPNTGYIQTSYTCPVGSHLVNNTPPGSNDRIYECAITIPDILPPKSCVSCLGDPIFASVGQKMQAETDYSGLPGLNFTRTYRSNSGFFTSVLTESFINNSSSSVPMQGCYPGYWTYSGASGVHCSTYISTYPYLSAQYQLQTEDGRSLEFTGPNDAVTASVDINERVTMLSVSGATEWQVQREDDTIEIYNAAGALIQKTLRGGQVFTYTYSTASTPVTVAPHAGLLLTQSDAFGHTLSWSYNAGGQMSQMTDPAGGITQYSYDASGNLTGVIYPDTSSKTYWYNEPANTGGDSIRSALTGITDENGVRYATFQYMSSPYTSGPFAVNTQHAGGVDNYTFTYNASSYYGSPITSTIVTDPLGTSRTYHFQNNLSYNVDSSQTQPAASGTGTVTQSETYDANGNPQSVTDYNGNVTHTVYDLTRNLETSRTEAYGTAQARTITTSWNPSYRVPSLITEPNRTTAFTYDSSGNALTKTVTDKTVTPNVSRTWTYTYDGYGRMLTAQGPRTDVNSTTTYTYYTCTTGYQCGELHTVTDAVGNVTTYNTYNAHGQPLTITDPNGVVTTLTYDARQRLTSRQVGSDTTGFSYYATGLLKKVTLPDGSYIQYSYDGAHRLTQISDGVGNSIQYTLDAMGNRTAENVYDPSSTLHRTHTRAFNALNHLYQDINAANTSAVTTTYGYDSNGNQTTINAPLTRNTTNAYDPLNRLTQITDPANGNTYFGYDAEDDLTSVKDPRSLTTSYGYNGFGDLTTQTSPDTGSTTNTFDSGGNLATSTDARGAVSTYAYDAQNRVTSIVYSLGGVSDQTIVSEYDSGTHGKGRLTSASDANHSLSWTYDGLGRVTGKGLTVGTVSKSVGYGYTNADLTSLVTPSGQAVTYGYNSNHQITSIAVNGTTVLSGVTYEPFGGVKGWTWGNGTSTTRSFNSDGLISQIVSAGTTLGYSYDNANRISGITDSSNSALSWSYGYDALDRLTSATTSSITDGWTYDANGNRLTQTGTTATTFSVNSTNNQLSSSSGSLARPVYVYDAAGHTQAYGSYVFTYNNRGRLMATNAGPTNYLYNALGQMIEKSGTSGATVFMQDEAGHLIGEYDGIGNLIEETIWLGDIPVATLQFGTSALKTYYVHTDHLNTPRRITNRNTNIIVWRWDSDPFGNGAAVQNPQGTVTVTYNLRFPGQYYQAETGLSQNYFRDFDPAVGRYVESDPIGLAGGSYSTYSYTGGNPISRADPRGLAYFAFRPLGGWPWLGPASKNPIDDYLGTDLSHEQLFFEDNQAPVNLGFFEDGTLKTEPNPTGYRDKSGHFNDCIMRKAAAAAPLPLPYCVIGHNCQTWADRVRTAYRRLEKDPAVQKECGVCK